MISEYTIIDQIGLSTRSHNCLRRAGVHTVGEMLKLSESDMLKMRNLGKASLLEIQSFINDIKLQISHNIPENISQESHFSYDAPIDKSLFSITAYNFLYKAGIRTYGQLLALTESNLRQICNFNYTYNEIKTVIGSIQTKSNQKEFPIEAAVPTFRDSDGILRKDIPLGALELSVRSFSCLTKNGIQYASELLYLDEVSLCKFKYIGSERIKEILNLVKSLDFEIATDHPDNAQLNAPINIAERFANTFNAIVSIHKGNFINTIMPVINEYCLNQIEDDERQDDENTIDFNLIEKIIDIPLVKTLLKQHVISVLKQNLFGINFETLAETFPNKLLNPQMVEAILAEMIKENEVLFNEQKYERRLPYLLEYLEDNKEDRSARVFICRIKGDTLEAAGQRFGLTRERIRQIEIKYLNKFKFSQVFFREDRYRDLFQKYEFDRKTFLQIFGESKETYNYLNIRYTNGNQPVEEIIEDIACPIEIRKAVEKYIYRDYLLVDGERIKIDRSTIADYLLRTKFTNDSSFDDFAASYNQFLIRHNLAANDKLAFENSTYMNKFADADNVLWKHHSRLRYYDFSQFDFTELLQTLALDQYIDIEYSTRKFLRDYPDLMNQYDVRDEYELHNLLKKLYKTIPDSNVKFVRMPMIAFGNADRYKQIQDLLMQFAPVTLDKLADEYESEYGVRTDTLKNDILKNFSIYYHDSLFTIDTAPLDVYEADKLRDILTEDFYLLSEITRTYIRTFPCANPENINPYTIKTLGFKVYSNYAINNKYISAADYFRHLLTDNDIVDINEFNKSISQLNLFLSQLASQKSQFEIIEFSPLKFINIRRLNTLNIFRENILDFCNAVYGFAEADKYFTIASIQKQGFSHALDNLGFEEWFYGSILAEDKERFSFRRMGNTRVFHKGTSIVLFKDFIKQIVEEYTSIDIYELQDIIANEYSVITDISIILKHVHDSSMYYDPIMEKVYIDYQTYFEEV